MNTQLAGAVAQVISEKWDPSKGLKSKEIYEQLIALGIDVPEGTMEEIFDTFIRAGIIAGSRRINREAYRQHGCMDISSVNLALLNQLEFD